MTFAAVLATACQSSTSSSPTGPPEPVVVYDAAPGTMVDAVAYTDAAKAAPDNAAVADIAAVGAIPAWQAVVDRSRMLERRGERGVVYGVVGDPLANLSNTTWLIDDQDGAGALGIVVHWKGPPPPRGSRALVGGAWALTPERSWIWNMQHKDGLAGEVDPSLDLTGSSHAVTQQPLPTGARPPQRAEVGKVMTFTVVAMPSVAGDGWKIARELGDEPLGILYLPGERESYGGNDWRSDAEKWKLKRGRSYWVRIGAIRPGRPGVLSALFADAAPHAW